MGSLGTSLGLILRPRIARITRIGSFGTSLGLILSPRIARITRIGSLGTSLVVSLRVSGFKFARYFQLISMVLAAYGTGFRWPDGKGFNIGKRGKH